MSTKKEKWVFENLMCKLPHCRCMQQSPCSNHHYSDECFSSNDHSQSESIECVDDIFTDYFFSATEGRNDKRRESISKAITTAVSNREKEIAEEVEKKQIDENTSDGYHTFKELYDHRITLYIALCKQITHQPYCDDKKFGVWRSQRHFDGSNYDGWFILGIGREKGKQITYHIPIEKWDECDFADTLDKAPDFDGHTSDDVLERLKTI